jgi:hypothetical protein
MAFVVSRLLDDLAIRGVQPIWPINAENAPEMKIVVD